MVADMDAEKPFGERKENSYGRVMDHHNSLHGVRPMKVSIKQRTGGRKQRLFLCCVPQSASYQALDIVRSASENALLSKDLSKRSMPLVYGRALN